MRKYHAPMRIYLVCPVRKRTPEQQADLDEWVTSCEQEFGHEVYYPGRDTGVAEAPENATGITACNIHHIQIANEVHVYYEPGSTGSLFDLGVAWALNKPIALVNPIQIKQYADAGDAWAILLLERVRRSEYGREPGLEDKGRIDE